MNIFIIPSWYPSSHHPSTGIFFKEQTKLIAHNHPNINFGISTWGSHDERLLLEAKGVFQTVSKFFQRKVIETKTNHSENCIEYLTPAFTWTRKFRSGNINGIIKSNEVNLSKFQKQFGPVDLIHAHVTYPGGYVAMEMAQKLKIPYIITEHMTPFPFATFIQKNSNVSKWIKEPLKKASRVIAVSSFLKDKLTIYTSNEIPIVFNNIDEVFFDNSPLKKQSEFKILNIGRLETQKSHDTLLTAMKSLVDQDYQFKLNIVGSGSLKSFLKKRTKQLSLSSHVSWLGQLDRDEVKEELRKSDFLVLSSLHENNPVVLLEAIACGKPIIATACDGPEDIVNDVNGLLAKPNNPQDLAEKIARMIEAYDQYDAKAIRTDFEKRFSSKVITPKIVNIYEQVIQEYSG